MMEVGKILDNLGIHYKDIGDDYRVTCWHHEDNTPSMTIHKASGVYHCFSCHRAGNLITLLKDHLGLDYVDSLLYLRKYSKGGGTDEEAKQHLEKMISTYGQAPDKSVLYTDVVLPDNVPIKSNKYLVEERGITPEEIHFWDMRLCKEQLHAGWILIPVYFGGVLRTYFLRDPVYGRKIYGKQDRPDILFGLDKLGSYRGIVGVTEGIFDLICGRRIGVPFVSPLSNRILDGQVEVLKRFYEVVLFHDNDDNEAGMFLIKDAMQLIPYTRVSVASLPLDVKDCADISKYSPAKIQWFTQEAFDKRIPIEDFIIMQRYRKFLMTEHQKKIKKRPTKPKKN